MRIALVANDGSPIGVTPPDIYGRGVGGAELAMMSLMRVFAERGHEVEVYNDPRPAGEHQGVQYKTRKSFNDTHPRDAVIVFRSPNPLVTHRCAATTIWWSCDQYTIGDYAVLGRSVDHIVCISDFHKHYHMQRYGLPKEKINVIDLGVAHWDYDVHHVEKIPGRMIYCSVPDRGLTSLLAAWPQIKAEAPQASLVITADYTLWGTTANNARHRLAWAGQEDVRFAGKVSRQELTKLQLEAEIHAYPCIYDELFCISCAETQFAGALPVTSTWGALETTNEFGVKVPGNPSSPDFVRTFAKRCAGLVTTERDYLKLKQENMMRAAAMRFDWNRIAEEWEALIEKGKQS